MTAPIELVTLSKEHPAVVELMQSYDAACIRAEAAEAERDEARRQLAEAQALIEQVRAEALARFEAVDKDHTMDNDTEAWLLEVAQRLEAYQFEHTAPVDWREDAR